MNIGFFIASSCINFSHKILIKFEMKIKFPLKNNFSIFLLLCLRYLEEGYLDLLLVIPIEFKLYSNSLHKGFAIMYIETFINS